MPLEDVVFDTFNGSFVRLSDATPQLIERLRDVIRPIHEPQYEGPEGGIWLRDDDLIIGYEGETSAYAYPIKMLNFHETVNDVIDGIPVLISYCPLCAISVAFSREVNGRVLVFGNTSALFENDLVMFDYETGSYWFQVGGEAIVGTLTGKRLTILPSAVMPWNQWLQLHPDTRVLSREQGFGRSYPYERDSFDGYSDLVDDLRFPFPISKEKIDDRLKAGAIVLSVQVGDQEKAYPLENIGDAAVNDAISEEPVVVFSRNDGPIGRAFSRRLEGRILTFRLQDGQILDTETGSRWDLSGNAVDRALAGQRLEQLPTRRAFWFSLSLAAPGIALYQP